MQRYRIIYLPAMLTVSSDVWDILTEYVEQGRRLVLDMPGFYFDDRSQMWPSGENSRFAEIFGCTLDDFQYASNVPRRLTGSHYPIAAAIPKLPKCHNCQ